MKLAGTVGSEDRKKFIAVCCFAVLAIFVLYLELRDPTPTAPPPPPVITTSPAQASIAPGNPASPAPTGPSARRIGTTDAALDPTLHTEPMARTESVAYEGTGRNIFSAAPVEVAIPKPIQPARPVPVVQGPPPPPPGPPPPPPIDLKFCGYFLSPAGDRQIILLQGDDVVLARQGDVVLRRYKVLSVSANSIQVEDMPNNNRQVLPLVAN